MKLGYGLVLLFGLYSFACGAPEPQDESVGQQASALGASCNKSSDPVCVGLATGAVCESTGHCRPDPDYPGACDCIVPAAPPPSTPPAACHCSDGTTVGSACRLGGTCRPYLGGMMLSCTCQ